MTEEVKIPKNVTGVPDYLFMKTVEECGEAIQEIMKMFQHGATEENRTRVAEELSDVSTFIAFLIDLELIDNKVFWAKHDKTKTKYVERIKAMVERAENNNNDSDGRKDSSDGLPGDGRD